MTGPKPPTEDSDLPSARLAVTSAALAGDAGGLYHIVSKLLGDGVPFDTVLFDLLIPVERDLGHRWQQGDYLVTEEHAATAAIETVISLLAGSFDQPENGVSVVVATAEGDDHSLPSRAISAHLLFLGYKTVFLGANVLGEDLREYLESEQPAAVVLSCAMSTHLPGARSIIQASHQAGIGVMAGGKGFGPNGEWAGALGADAWIASLKEVATTLETWQPDPAGAEARARTPDGEVRDLIETWPGVVSRARAGLAENSIPPERNARALSELGLLLDSVIAAMLVEDPGVAEEMLKWQKSTLASHRLEIHDALVDGLQGALDTVAPGAAEILRQARQAI